MIPACFICGKILKYLVRPRTFSISSHVTFRIVNVSSTFSRVFLAKRTDDLSFNWHSKSPSLTIIFSLARKSLVRLERKFPSNHEFEIKYRKFIQEYNVTNHMSLASTEYDVASDKVSLSLATQHRIFNGVSTNPKLRVVFYALVRS